MRHLWRVLNTFGYCRTIEPNVKSGDKLRFLQSAETPALTSWKAPFTGGCEVVVPAGTVVKVLHDSVRSAAGFSCAPVDYDDFGLRHIPEHAQKPESYAGYHLVVAKSQIGSAVELWSTSE
jgi:hypothetical protein